MTDCRRLGPPMPHQQAWIVPSVVSWVYIIRDSNESWRLCVYSVFSSMYITFPFHVGNLRHFVFLSIHCSSWGPIRVVVVFLTVDDGQKLRALSAFRFSHCSGSEGMCTRVQYVNRCMPVYISSISSVELQKASNGRDKNVTLST